MTNEVEAVCGTAAGVATAAKSCLGGHLEEGNRAVGEMLRWLTEKGTAFAVDLAVSAVILVIGYFAIKLISAAIDKALRKPDMKKSLFAVFIASVVTKTCWALLIIMVLSRLGLNVAPLIAGLGVTGFILGFAFQETLGNFAAGMMIAINEPFKVGDTVQAAGHLGTIREMNMMATVMTSADNKKIVLPNKSVWGGPITNFSALSIRRVDMQVGIAYGEDISKAVAIVKDVLSRMPGVLDDPAPTVAVAGLDSSQITLNIRPWAQSTEYFDILSETLKSVKEEFDKAGVEIPFPQITVHNAVS
ncbi:MAG: mechanosensitive ion channel family protein [Kiritimatiellae bacterium]|nr:mechanosensitive ion channel family protein [Kiritimatiellia bacterium]